MSRLTVRLALLAILLMGAKVQASSILYDSVFNVNGAITEASLAIPGLDSSNFDEATGIGTLVFTFNPGKAGSYNFDAWFDHDLSVPNYNEYGVASGTPAPGQTWEIGDPTSYYDSGGTPGQGGPGVDIVDDTALNVLNNTNSLPGNTDNYLGNCTGASCNGDASLAMGFNFTLTANQEEIVTLMVTEAVPEGLSGLVLQQIHPVDGCDQNGQNCANPTQLNLFFSGNAVTQGTGPGVPEPGTWLLVSTMLVGIGLLRFKLRWMGRIKVRGGGSLLLLLFLVAIPHFAQAQAVVSTVPWQPSNPTVPHTTYNVCSDGTIPIYTTNPPTCTNSSATLSEATIRLGAIVSLPNTSDTYTGVWNFGDGSPNFSFSVNNTNLINYDVSTTHQYPAADPAGKTYTAVLTITDTNTSVQGSGNYFVIQEEDTLSSRVNVAIDAGLWYQHTVMWRSTTVVNGNNVNIGGWDDFGEPCTDENICTSYGGLDANFVQAFEVNGHLENGPASDPYTDDVARGLARMMNFLNAFAPAAKSVTIDPSIWVDRCSDGTVPDFTQSPPVCATGTLIQYNPNATTCTTPPCSFTFDLNSNGQMLMEGNDSGNNIYQVGMFVDAIVASGNPAGTAKAGVTASGSLPGVFGQTYKDIVTDLADGINYCQYGGDYYSDGSDGADAGGGWQYNCAGAGLANYNDNSVSQWNAVGLIGAERGFGISIPQITRDMNQVWVTYSQDVNGENAGSQYANGTITGSFGYSQWGYNPWGTFADTPSGMVQMAMDQVGRTAANDPDQRWNVSETYYHDNFCFNATNPNNAYYYYDPLYYTYGMFSFTKSMLLHDPGGVLSPITTIADQPGGTNPIDWYGALSPANGGTDACDGFAQTLVSRQQSDGHWGNVSFAQYFDENYVQGYFETPWALIILKQSIFVACINDLGGKGKPTTRFSPATVTLTWAHQPNAVSYNIYRSQTSGGPYNKVANTTTTYYVDQKSLKNATTYYYVVNPVNTVGTEICQSNQATVRVPRYHP